MIVAAKAIVSQVWLLLTQSSLYLFLSAALNNSNPAAIYHVIETFLCLQCVADSVVQIEEIDAEVVVK